MTRVVHDYKGRDIYHLIRNGKRYEFKIDALWAEQFNDALPSAIGITVVTLNPTVLLPLKLENNRVDFVLYMDKIETQDVRDLMRNMFESLAILLWGTSSSSPQANEQLSNYIVTEAVHLSSGLMIPGNEFYRAPKLFKSLVAVKQFRVRMNYTVKDLPARRGSIFLGGVDGTGKRSVVILDLATFEREMGSPFYDLTKAQVLAHYDAQLIKVGAKAHETPGL